MATNLVDSGIAARSMTFLAIGGSGIRMLEPLLHLSALGLGPRRLNVVLIDPDQSNEAVTRSRALLDLYRRTRQALTYGAAPSDGYFRTEVSDAVGNLPLWSPIADDEGHGTGSFAARMDRSLMTGPAGNLAHLVDLLYSKQMQEMDLALGFRGVPSIGTVFMNRLREQRFFEQLLVDGQTDSESVFFTAGSIFGGTGAAGIPVVGRVLVDGLTGLTGRNDVRGIPRRRVGAALFLPYFTLPAPSTRAAADGGIRPEVNLFSQNAAAAIPTYASDQAGYGGFYMIGDDQPREQNANEVGGEAQKNASHYVELFGALAALDFAARGGEPQQDALPVFRMTGVADTNVRWDDLPIDSASRARLLGGFVAAHTFLRVFRPDGRSHPSLERGLKGATWVDLLGITQADLRRQSGAFDLLGQFFDATWRWAAELRASTPALELLGSEGGRPTEVPLHETIEGRRSHESLPGTTDSGMEIFRHWNMAAHVLRSGGYGAFLEVMRRGSELFAAQRFSEAVNA